MSAASKPQPRIMIIEDDQSIRESLAEVLACEGYETACAIHGLDALETLRSGGDMPDLILLDLTMPVMNGWEFLIERNREPRLARIPVVVCSATGDKRQPENASVILKKPLQLRVLLGCITDLLASAGEAAAR